MDIIERVFHFSPDGGSGLIEGLLLLLAFLIIVTLVLDHCGVRRRRA